MCKSSSQIVTTNKLTANLLQTGCPSCCPTNSVKALKGKALVGKLWLLHINNNRKMSITVIITLLITHQVPSTWEFSAQKTTVMYMYTQDS